MAAWLAAIGFLRLRTTLDRLHCSTFVAASSGPLMVVAALLDEGLTVRSAKMAALVLALLVTGAATSHAVGRAVLMRDGPRT